MDHWSHCDSILKEVMTKKPGMVQAGQKQSHTVLKYRDGVIQHVLSWPGTNLTEKKKKVLETCLKWFESTVHKIVFQQKKRETIT